MGQWGRVSYHLRLPFLIEASSVSPLAVHDISVRKTMIVQDVFGWIQYLGEVGVEPDLKACAKARSPFAPMLLPVKKWMVMPRLPQVRPYLTGTWHASGCRPADRGIKAISAAAKAGGIESGCRAAANAGSEQQRLSLDRIPWDVHVRARGSREMKFGHGRPSPT